MWMRDLLAPASGHSLPIAKGSYPASPYWTHRCSPMLVKSQALGSRVVLDCVDKQTWAQELCSETTLHQAQLPGTNICGQLCGKRDAWCCILATLQTNHVLGTHHEVSQEIRGQSGRDGHPEGRQELDPEGWGGCEETKG